MEQKFEDNEIHAEETPEEIEESVESIAQDERVLEDTPEFKTDSSEQDVEEMEDAETSLESDEARLAEVRASLEETQVSEGNEEGVFVESGSEEVAEDSSPTAKRPTLFSKIKQYIGIGALAGGLFFGSAEEGQAGEKEKEIKKSNKVFVQGSRVVNKDDIKKVEWKKEEVRKDEKKKKGGLLRGLFNTVVPIDDLTRKTDSTDRVNVYGGNEERGSFLKQVNERRERTRVLTAPDGTKSTVLLDSNNRIIRVLEGPDPRKVRVQERINIGNDPHKGSSRSFFRNTK